jgi:hypothetical protein
MAAGIRATGEIFYPDGSLKPRSWSTASGDEITLALQYHPIDIVFDFYVNDTTVPPATGIWTILSPRANGVITDVDYRVNTNGTESNNSDVFNILLNGSDKITDAIVRDSTTEDTWIAATITGTTFSFAADDIISVDWTNANTSDATGLKIRILGYYVGD